MYPSVWHCTTNNLKLSGIKWAFYHAHKFSGVGLQTRNMEMSCLCSSGSGLELGRLEQLGKFNDSGWGCLVTSLLTFGTWDYDDWRLSSLELLSRTPTLHMTSLPAWGVSQCGGFTVARVLAWPLGAAKASVAFK